jgi:hypothetical protein
MRIDGIVNRPLAVAAVWLLMAVAATYIFIFEPGKSGFFPLCPFRALTGFTCPGCGTTRALHHLLHGDLWSAFQLNPFTMLMLPILLYVLVRHTYAVMRGQVINKNQLDARFIWVLFVVVLSFWIFRNTPFYPFAS